MPPTYTCLIADDDMLDRDVLEMYLSKIGSLKIEAICTDGLEAISTLQQKNIDIVFSDIEMPGLSGLDLIQSLPNPPVFIFISSHTELAAESYNLDVIDFIVKPVTLPRLIKAANKAIEYIELKKKAATMNAAPAETAAPKPADTTDHFYIKENYDYTRVDNTELIFVESMGNFSSLHTTQKKKHITLVSLKNIEVQLPAGQFMRVHKQYIVNLQHIQSIASDGHIMLTDGHSIPLGDMYKAPLMEVIGKKMLLR